MERGVIGRAFKYQWLPRGTERNSRNNNRNILSPKPELIRPKNCSNLHYGLSVPKLWKPIPFANELKFTVPGKMSQENFTKSLNVRRHSCKRCRSVFGAALNRKIDRSLNYIWVTEKWNVNMAWNTSKIILVKFLLSELHNSCSSLEEGSKISTITQKRQNFILSEFPKMHKDRFVQILVPWSLGRLYFICLANNISSKIISL